MEEETYGKGERKLEERKGQEEEREERNERKG
jgi:hypothetical protein